ncbi:unnamed protein product [Sympodiomycopsis kandeliae]
MAAHLAISTPQNASSMGDIGYGTPSKSSANAAIDTPSRLLLPVSTGLTPMSSTSPRTALGAHQLSAAAHNGTQGSQNHLTPGNTASAGPNTGVPPLSSFGLALGANGSLSLAMDPSSSKSPDGADKSAAASFLNASTIPSLPPISIGPHAILTIVCEQDLLRSQWLRVVLIIKSLEARIKATYVPSSGSSEAGSSKTPFEKVEVLFQAITCRKEGYPAESSQWPQEDDGILRFGPMRIDEFCLQTWRGLSDPQQVNFPLSSFSNGPQGSERNPDESVTAALTKLSEILSMEDEQSPDKSSPLLGHYMVYVTSPQRGEESTVTPNGDITDRIAPKLRGIATAVVPNEQSQVTSSRNTAAINPLHEALSKNLGRSVTLDDASPILSSPTGSSEGKGASTASTDRTDKQLQSYLKNVRIHFAGFRQYTEAQARATLADVDSKKRSREEGAAADPGGSVKRTKMENGATGPSEAAASVSGSAQGALPSQQVQQSEAPRPTVLWNGIIAWDVQDPSAGKKEIKLWASALHVGGSRNAGPSPNLVTPWPTSLPLAVLKPIALEKLQRFVTQSGVSLVIFSPDVAATSAALPGQQPPSTAEEIANNKRVYLSLAQTLDQKKSAVWLRLGDKKGQAPSQSNRAGLEQESRTSPGVLVVSLSGFPAGSLGQRPGQPGQAQSARGPPRLLGLVLPTGVPWEVLTAAPDAPSLPEMPEVKSTAAPPSAPLSSGQDDMQAQVLAMKQRMAMQQAQQARMLQQSQQRPGQGPTETNVTQPQALSAQAGQPQSQAQPPAQQNQTAQQPSQANFNVTPSGLPNMLSQLQNANPTQQAQFMQSLNAGALNGFANNVAGTQGVNPTGGENNGSALGGSGGNNLPNLGNLPPNFLATLNALPGFKSQNQQQQIQMLTAAMQMKARHDQQQREQQQQQLQNAGQLNPDQMRLLQQQIQQQQQSQSQNNPNRGISGMNWASQGSGQQGQAPQAQAPNAQPMQGQPPPFDMSQVPAQWGLQPSGPSQSHPMSNNGGAAPQQQQQQQQQQQSQSQPQQTQQAQMYQQQAQPQNGTNPQQPLMPNLNTFDVNQLQAMLGMNMK